ncbi:MAG: hypothetical protein JWN73_2548 [Betaproteobacteria bacterium]|nr:hypothetical protein [Betaproteobacteria bacterium]
MHPTRARRQKSLRPSTEIGLAVVAALALPRPAFARLATERGQPALELGAALRVCRGSRGRLAIQTRASLASPWRDASHLEDIEVLDTDSLIEHALNHAARAHLAHAIELCGLQDSALPPEQKVYAERRLRADLFPAAATAATAHRVRALLLAEVLGPGARRPVFLVHGRRARFRDFNEARAAGLKPLVRITAETPNLAPLLAPLIRARARKQAGIIADGAIGEIRAALLAQPPAERLAPRDWKWLARQPNGVVRRLCAAGGDGRLDTLAVRLFAGTGETRLPRAILELDHRGGPLDRALASLAASGAERAEAAQAQLEDLARLMRLLIREARERARRSQSLRFLRDDAGYLIDWWLDEAGRGGPLIGQNATYASLIRRQQRWHQLMILRSPEHMQMWQSALPAYQSAGLRVVPLTDSLMLAREGMEMRHCVASYSRDCARGDTRIFALEDVDTGERATLELRRRSWVWFAGQIKGICNAEVSSRLRVAADRLASRYTAAAQHA